MSKIWSFVSAEGWTILFGNPGGRACGVRALALMFASWCVKIWSFVSAEGWTILFCNPGREKLWPCMWC